MSDTARAGISGMSLYVPALRVPLEQWCAWTGSPWNKVKNVVGNSFRCPGPRENVYTMAAGAVLRLIRDYDVDPQRVRMLALGTETSTDNSAGAVIVRGMVDRALDQLGLPRLSRALEVPELLATTASPGFIQHRVAIFCGATGLFHLVFIELGNQIAACVVAVQRCKVS